MGNKGSINIKWTTESSKWIALTLTSIFFSGWILIEKDITFCLCVAHVFGHVLKYHKSTEQNPALHCKTKLLLVSCRCGVGKLRGLKVGMVGGLPVVSAHASSELISANRLCQLRDGTWAYVVVLKYRSLSGVKHWLGAVKGRVDGGGGLKELNDVDFFPQLTCSRP